MTTSSHSSAETLLSRFEAYQPQPTGAIAPFWPPRVRPRRWRGNRRDITVDAIHYDRAEIAALLALLDEKSVGRGRVLLSDFYSGLSTLFWGLAFDKVFTFSVRDHAEPSLSDGKHTIFFGRVGDMPFLYQSAERIGEIDALLIDGTVRYDLVMILYYTFRRHLRDKGIVVFFNTRDTSEPSGGIPRFLSGLRSAEIDGIAHTVHDLDVVGGQGIAYEQVTQ